MPIVLLYKRIENELSMNENTGAPLPSESRFTSADYSIPSNHCPDPRLRPHLDLEAACPPERLQELKQIEVESTWRGLPGQRRGRARDGVTMLCDIMGHGSESLVTRALKLFGEDAFRIALRHTAPGAISSKLWKYWHLRLHNRPPERRPPTMRTLRIARGLLPPDTPDPEPLHWPG